MYYNDPTTAIATAAGEIIGTYIAIGFWIGHLAIPISILISTFPAWRQDELRKTAEQTIGHPIHPRALVKRLPHPLEPHTGTVTYGIPQYAYSGRINPMDLYCHLTFDQWSIAATQPEHVSTIAHHLRTRLGYKIPAHPIEVGKDQPVASSDLKPYLPQGTTIAYPRELIWGFPSPTEQA